MEPVKKKENAFLTKACLGSCGDINYFKGLFIMVLLGGLRPLLCQWLCHSFAGSRLLGISFFVICSAVHILDNDLHW